MNPMSLLTLPPALLREAVLRPDEAHTRGERGERRVTLALAFVACLMVAALAFA
jgi:hypothetical protein